MNRKINIEGFKAENGYCGLRNKITGEALTRPLYSKITLDGECLCIGDNWYEDTLHLMRTNIENLYIMIDYYDDGCKTFCKLFDVQQGKAVSDSYNFMSTQFVCGLCRVAGEKDGYIDVTGKQVVMLEKYCYADNPDSRWFYYGVSYRYSMYDELETESKNDFRDFTEDGLAAVRFLQNSKDPFSDRYFIWGYINTRGEIAISPQYDSAGDFINGKAKVTLGGEKFYIDKQGNII